MKSQVNALAFILQYLESVVNFDIYSYVFFFQSVGSME